MTISEQIGQAFFAVLGGLISGGVGIFLADYGRRRQARDAFLITMSELIDETQHDSDYEEFAPFHARTLGRVGPAISRVKPFLSRQKAETLDAWWLNYQHIGKRPLDPTKEQEWLVELSMAFKVPVPEKTNRILALYLQKFCEVVK